MGGLGGDHELGGAPSSGRALGEGGGLGEAPSTGRPCGHCVLQSSKDAKVGSAEPVRQRSRDVLLMLQVCTRTPSERSVDCLPRQYTMSVPGMLSVHSFIVLKHTSMFWGPDLSGVPWPSTFMQLLSNVLQYG